jgi:hypothetical protein
MNFVALHTYIRRNCFGYVKIRWIVLKIYACIGTVNGKRLCFILIYEVINVTKGTTALIPEKDYDQTAIGLPLVMCAVFFLAKSFW